ncbi:hypothetical protein B0H14DRAFT_2428823 [Mycena olivaceomarginata]|nr:hypothetical protein B0H14DRAFT_2428823 [Mycena olivaceomarginata]
MDLETHTANMARRDSEFYHYDGNIVLSAKDKENRTIYFRLHKSILAKQSPIFADMFTAASPVDQYDGVPLVVMPGDDADEMRAFIALFYEPQCITTILEETSFTFKLLGPARLANKYQVDWISKMIVSQLEKSWPSTLQGWLIFAYNESESDIRSYDAMGDPSWGDKTLELREFPEPVSSILLARECNATSILPCAFLELLRRHPEVVDASLERSLLSLHDSHRLLLARERIGRWYADHGWKLTLCQSDKLCQVTLLHASIELAKQISRDGHALQLSIRGDNYRSDRMCPGCKTEFVKEVQALENDFFEQLSSFFDLNG